MSKPRKNPKKITADSDENDVKELVQDWFKARKAWHYAAIQNGLGVHGIHDRLGCVPIVVTPAMVGKKVGLFVSVEAKRPGRREEKDRGMTPHQRDNMIDIIKASGLSVVCDGQDDLDILDHWITVLTEAPL